MPEENAFKQLLHRVRAGEEEAATELVRQYEPAIRRAVRVRLVDPHLKRVFESADICQSVLASFFVRAALGQYEVSKPEELLKLLVTMARNKLASQARRQQAERRDNRLECSASPDLLQVAATGPSPSELVSAKELLEKFREQLPAEERHLAEQRALGREWADIATELGVDPEVLRKRLARAVARVARALGLEV